MKLKKRNLEYPLFGLIKNTLHTHTYIYKVYQKLQGNKKNSYMKMESYRNAEFVVFYFESSNFQSQ